MPPMWTQIETFPLVLLALSLSFFLSRCLNTKEMESSDSCLGALGAWPEWRGGLELLLHRGPLSLRVLASCPPLCLQALAHPTPALSCWGSVPTGRASGCLDAPTRADGPSQAGHQGHLLRHPSGPGFKC